MTTFTLSVNLHGCSVELREREAPELLGRYSYGKYLYFGIERILALLDRHTVKATFFVPGFEAVSDPGLIREVAAAGHEIAAHGYLLEDHSQLGEREPELLARAHDALCRATGQAPQGWRAPDGMLSRQTMRHLAALGYMYDSSFQDDDHPYRHAAEEGGLVEVPQNEMLIDATLFNARQTHDRVLKNWTEEFAGLQSEGCYGCMTLHPRPDYGVGRPSRIELLDTFLRHIRRAHPEVGFATCLEVARAAAA